MKTKHFLGGRSKPLPYIYIVSVSHKLSGSTVGADNIRPEKLVNSPVVSAKRNISCRAINNRPYIQIETFVHRRSGLIVGADNIRPEKVANLPVVSAKRNISCRAIADRPYIPRGRCAAKSNRTTVGAPIPGCPYIQG